MIEEKGFSIENAILELNAVGVAATDRVDFHHSYINDLLLEVRFEDLVKLTGSRVNSAYDVFDILRPLLTRRKFVAWNELVTPGASWRDSVKALDLLGYGLRSCEDWSVDLIGSTIIQMQTNSTSSRVSASELLYRCVLFSEFRLPLFSSLWHVGRAECLARLEYASNNLTQMNLVG
jgi:hypothetical protein